MEQEPSTALIPAKETDSGTPQDIARRPGRIGAEPPKRRQPKAPPVWVLLLAIACILGLMFVAFLPTEDVFALFVVSAIGLGTIIYYAPKSRPQRVY